MATVTFTRGGGGVRGQAKSLCTYNRPPSSGPSDKSYFFPRNDFLMWVGGWVGWWVGQAEEPRLPFRPPPPGNGKDALMPDCGVHYLWFAFVCF